MHSFPVPPMEKMRSALLDPLTPPASVSVLARDSLPNSAHLLWQVFKFLPHHIPRALEKRVVFEDFSLPSSLNIKNYSSLPTH